MMRRFKHTLSHFLALLTIITGASAACTVEFLDASPSSDSSGALPFYQLGTPNTIQIGYLKVASASGCSGLHFEAIIDPVFANSSHQFQSSSPGVHDLAAAVIEITPVSSDPIGIIVKLVDSDGVIYRSTDIVLYEDNGSSYDTNTLEVPCWIGCVDPSPVYFTGFVP